MSTISKKICLIGDFGVGKTSLIRRFVERQFSDRYLSTVGVKISRKTIELLNNQAEKLNLQLLIWDLEGHTKFKSIAPTYLQGASGAAIVADVSRPETIERLTEHINLFLSVNKKGIIVVAFNKVDLIAKEDLAQIVEGFQAKAIAQVLAIYQTSAKTSLSVDEMFQTLVNKIVETGNKEQSSVREL